MRTYSIYSVVFVTGFLTTVTTVLPSTSSNIAVAQISPMSEDFTKSENLISQVNVLFVNPTIGNDQSANGRENAPLKTITQALQIAKDNTVIRLSRGTYSTESGEKFPLILKKGVSIQGDIPTQGKEIIIQGGGEYLSRYYGSKNIGIVAAGKAKLAGVTVMNPNPRGYGVWVELNRPVLEQNTFTGSTQDGVAVMGKAAPKVHNNYFYQNGANGITVSGESQPEIKGNIFQNTGFGINIAQNASPQVISNKISDNRTGVVVQAASRPVLRNNSIFNNKEDGLVVIAKAIPDLGNSSNPGGNQFSFNGRYDINAKAAKQEIAAYGNTLTDNRVVGKVNVTASAAPTKAQISQPPRISPTLLKPRATPQKPPTPQAEEQFNYVQVQGDAIEFSAPQAPQPIASKPSQLPANTPSLPTLKPAPVGESALSPISTAKIPLTENSNTNLPAPIVFTKPTTNQNPPLPQARVTTTQTASLLGSYRVIVEAVTPRQQELVRFIVPDAFRTTRGGRRVMQAGIFQNNGLKARIEAIR
jgi:parallel beta-helix repeat protein